MKLKDNFISILALAGLMFLAGAFIVGGNWRRKLIKEEMKAIQAKQQELILEIERRYIDALENDEKMLRQIEITQNVLKKINEEKAIVQENRDVIEEKLDQLSDEIEREKEDMKKDRDAYRIHFRDYFSGLASNQE